MTNIISVFFLSSKSILLWNCIVRESAEGHKCFVKERSRSRLPRTFEIKTLSLSTKSVDFHLEEKMNFNMMVNRGKELLI